jgi:hypothetical protein
VKISFANRGAIRFELESEDDLLRHRAITKACDIHNLPASVQVSECQIGDPWERVLEIGRLCRLQNVSLALNYTTIIGQSITGGDKSEFWQKAMPILFELVCLKLWPQMKPSSGFGQDSFIGKDGIDFKCKHREVSPGCDYIATVPVSQRRQNTKFYCFGQMSKGMKVGYILGVISKKDFAEKRQTKEKGDVDNNGERYVDPVDCVYINELYGWQPDTLQGFFPLKYRLEHQKNPASSV